MVEMRRLLKGATVFDEADIKDAVRDRYADHATNATSCCSPSITRAGLASCCGSSDQSVSERLGYDARDLAAIPEGADLGLGCGNPLAMLELKEGEIVLDLGSGAGIDCFLAAKRVGSTGRVIGVDMTPEMIARARRNAAQGGIDNVEFRLGEIEHLPVEDNSIDAVISNCVINLVPDKRQVFADVFRALKPGGRLSVSDIVTLGEIPLQIRSSVEAYVSCLSGAILRDDYLDLLTDVGFTDITARESRSFTVGDVVGDASAAEFAQQSGATMEEFEAAAALFQSVRVSARKPA
ncbi:MAG: arsenite methyltransferase [Coriobacteriia bacterium]|jgi:SAM-dependent methyltransferase|nr:arsenite methyltransferase [Coriobacteriia bacterium]